MSIKKTTKVVYECICELPDCPGKGQPWYSQDEAIPKRCRWCGHYSWNGVDRRRKTQGSSFVRLRQCSTCNGTKWTRNAEGAEVCATCHPSAKATAPLIANQKRRGRPPSSQLALGLPKPRKVRSIDND